VGYRFVFGRVETDVNGSQITRLGTASALSIVTNTAPYSNNVNVTATLPKNSINEISFLQLYRSNQTPSTLISPLDQYHLVYERALVSGDFTARTVTINDIVQDSLVGIPLYSGSDQEGIGQSNDPPPMCWDMCVFRDFAIYGNITRPSTLNFTVLSTGTPSGIQVGDSITIAGTFNGVAYSESYICEGFQSPSTRQFQLITSGTPSQNITSTVNNLIQCINYDNALPVHALLLSTSTDLPGQILLECDNPSIETFTVTANAHTTAYSPVLTGVVSSINTLNNQIGVSKKGELEAVPSLNLLFCGDTSANVLRIIALRDYCLVIKSDGNYKLQGTDPSSLSITPFDLTTQIVGPDTAVALNSAVWMLSTQGVVSISDGGTEFKSVPIDDQLNILIGANLSNLSQTSFAMAYESDRKYILCVPSGNNTFCSTEYNFNYVTNVWTTWSRNFYYGFIHSVEDRIYAARADLDEGVSYERDSRTYQDYVDEALSNTISSVAGQIVTLASVENLNVGDVLYQSSSLFSPIIAINLLASTVTTQFVPGFTVGTVQALTSYLCTMTWKQVYGDNPAFVHQYSDGMVLFKNPTLNLASLTFLTDYSPIAVSVPIQGVETGLWGLFGWGNVAWGGVIRPKNIRFLVPGTQQLGSYIIPSLLIQQGYSDWSVQGLAIGYSNVSDEVGT
jgi:hypothetical protein